MFAYKTSPVRRYDLYGVINHFGSMAAGHYTAACRVPLGKGKEDWCALLHVRQISPSTSWVAIEPIQSWTNATAACSRERFMTAGSNLHIWPRFDLSIAV